jgi:very-short-patch-repair endonuclease
MQRRTSLKIANTPQNQLWARLKAMEGYQFRRKARFGNFTVDFIEHNKGLVIVMEDAEPGQRLTHNIRDRVLSNQGYIILRLRWWEAEHQLHCVLHRIRCVLEDLALTDSV